VSVARLQGARRCYNYIEGLNFDRHSYIRLQGLDDMCPNYVNTRKPRRAYWKRSNAEKVCWAYICDWCFEDLEEFDDGWPRDDNGRFSESMECGLP